MERCLYPVCTKTPETWHALMADEGKFYFCDQHWPKTELEAIYALRAAGVRNG